MANAAAMMVKMKRKTRMGTRMRKMRMRMRKMRMRTRKMRTRKTRETRETRETRMSILSMTLKYWVFLIGTYLAKTSSVKLQL